MIHIPFTAYCKTGLLVCFLLIGTAYLSPCQDLTINTFQYDEQSIVRCVDDNHWLVYSHGKGNSFYLVNADGSAIDVKTFADHKIIVRDFEIFEDTVYYCGATNTNLASSNSVMGYFKLTGFQTNLLEYDERTTWASFNKLDVFRVGGQMHVVMTATYHNGVGTMIDARKFTPIHWDYCDADFANKYYNFHDVAVNYKYIIFTSQGDSVRPDTKSTTQLWFIRMPLFAGTPIFNNYTGYMSLHTLNVAPMDKVLIEKISGLDFAVATRQKDSIIISHFYDNLYKGSYDFPCDINEEIKDLKKSQNLDGVSVLVNNPTSTVTNLSRVFWVPIPNASSPFVGFYRYSDTEWINSIDPITGYLYTASGHDSYGTSLHVYRMNVLGQGDCFGRSDYTGKKMNYVHSHKYINFPQRSFPNIIGLLTNTAEIVYPAIICE